MNNLKLIAKCWGAGMLVFICAIPVGIVAKYMPDASLPVRVVALLLLAPILFGCAQRWFWSLERGAEQ